MGTVTKLAFHEFGIASLIPLLHLSLVLTLHSPLPIHLIQQKYHSDSTIQILKSINNNSHFLKMHQEQYQNEVQLNVRCREGPLAERKCTDVLCCLLYLLLLGSVILLAILSSSSIKMSQLQVQEQLSKTTEAHPLLAISSSVVYILISLSCVVALSFTLLVISFTIPSIAIYLVLPLMLILMLLLGSGFIYRFFGNKLPFVNENLQETYATQHSYVSFIVGAAFIFGFVISLIVILLKQQRLKFIVTALKIAKICFWQNCYMIFVSFILSAVSLGCLYGNLKMLQISQLQVQGQNYINKRILSILIIVEMLWTHGYLQAYSDFIFESIAVHWYFNQKKLQANYSRIRENLCPSIYFSIKHMGSIAFGWILAYIPQSFNVLMHQLEQKSSGCYNYCCCCHRWCCQNLSKYSHIGTIIYSQPFCTSSKTIRDIKQTAKHTFPQLYMIGNFYITLMKIFIILVSLVICYFLIAQHPQPFTDHYNLVAPLLVTLLASLQIATHFMDSTGLVADTLYLAYVIDYNCQSSNFGNLNAEHCPAQAYEVINQARIGKLALHD